MAITLAGMMFLEVEGRQDEISHEEVRTWGSSVRALEGSDAVLGQTVDTLVKRIETRGSNLRNLLRGMFGSLAARNERWKAAGDKETQREKLVALIGWDPTVRTPVTPVTP